MSINKKFTILTALIVLVISGSVLFFNTLRYNNHLEREVIDGLGHGIATAQEIFALKNQYTRTAAELFATDSALVAAIENGDELAVAARIGALRIRTNLTMYAVVDKNGIVLFEMNSHANVGDDTTERLVVQSALQEGAPSAGFYKGENRSIYVRSVIPVHGSEGGIAGAIVAGIRVDTDAMVDRLKYITGNEITFVVEDFRTATTLETLQQRRNTNSFVMNQTKTIMSAGYDEYYEYDYQRSILWLKHMPIYDAENELIALFITSRYYSDIRNEMVSFILEGVLVIGLILLLIIIVAIIVLRRVAEKSEESLNDALTGVYNRRYLEANLKKLFASLSRSDDRLLSLLMIDIDYFKKYNDKYGHPKGDECLKEVANILKSGAVRQDDFVARYGGEEFAIVLPHADEAGARVVAHKLIRKIREKKIPHKASEIADHVTISIGIACGRVEHTNNIEDFIDRADEALYNSKQTGRDKFSVARMT